MLFINFVKLKYLIILILFIMYRFLGNARGKEQFGSFSWSSLTDVRGNIIDRIIDN